MDLSGVLSKKQAKLTRIAAHIQNDQQSGKFFRITYYKRSALIVRLKKLAKRVKGLHWQIKLAALGGLAAATPAQEASAQATLGPFQFQTRANNPLRYPLKGDRLKPTIVDLDNDGDYDIVTGESYGYIKLYLNEGGPNAPKFSDYRLLLDDLNPISISGNAAPAFADLNGDGLLDLIVGVGGSSDRIAYFVNNGGTPGSASDPITFTEQNGIWDPVLKTGNPLYGILPGAHPVPFFVNFDGDGDMDLLTGHNYSNVGDGEQVHYYRNDGNSMFVLDQTSFIVSPTIVNSDNYHATPNLIDLDGDGELDFVMGNYIGELRFFKGGGGTFSEVNSPWNNSTKTGSPVYGISLNGFTSPAFADFDNDGDLDMVVGSDYKYNLLAYFENTSESPFQTGDSAFERIDQLNNPFNGIGVGQEAAPVWSDIDGDGDLDVAIGARYQDPDFTVLLNSGGAFKIDVSSSLYLIATSLTNVKPVFVDIDNDGDQDLFIASHDGIDFYKNDEGDFVGELSPIDFDGLVLAGDLTYTTELSLAFMDFDGDGDFDAFLGGDGVSPAPSIIQFLENQGTSEAPNFVGVPEPAPFDIATFEHRPNIISVDIDSDGDLDIILAETIYNNYTKYDNTVIRLFKNNNDGSFTEDELFILGSENISGASSIAFSDFDGDGDLDAFVGLGADYKGKDGGIVEYYLNQNPPPVTTVSPGPLVYIYGSGPAIVDATLTISDSDSDQITRATIGIQGYEVGDVLSFTPQGGVAGNFDTSIGILTLTGLADVATYEAILRSVTYEFIGLPPEVAEKKGGASGRTVVVNKTFEFNVLDADFTTAVTQSLAVELTKLNEKPVMGATASTTVYTGAAIVIDAGLTVGDPDDADLESATIQISSSTFVNGEDVLLFTDQNGITGSYNNTSGILTLTGIASVADYEVAMRSVQYQNSSGTPTATDRTIEFFVYDGEDLSGVVSKSITISVASPNQPPVFSPSPLGASVNGTLSLDLTTIASDPDGNLDTSTFGIVQQPASGVTASITGTLLTINYAGSNFVGPDNVIVEVYDLSGARAEATLSITVTNQPPVLTPIPIVINFNGLLTLDLIQFASDPNGNLDPSTFAIVQQPTSGIAASISGSDLIIDYTGSNFAGSDDVVIEVYDLAGDRAEATINITVFNQAPVITNTQLNTTVQGVVGIDLLSLVSDDDNNLDPTTFNIFQQPISGAAATISGTTLTIDYSNTTFAGLDNLIVEVFDLAGERAEATITIQVDGDIIVRNGMSPNGDGKNDYFRLENITALGAVNKVSIFNRWGDKVFEVENYDNQTRRFEGKSDGGSELPSGVYFYKITFDGSKTEISGYLTLKR